MAEARGGSSSRGSHLRGAGAEVGSRGVVVRGVLVW